MIAIGSKTKIEADLHHLEDEQRPFGASIFGFDIFHDIFHEVIYLLLVA